MSTRPHEKIGVAQISAEARAALATAASERHSVSNLEQVGVSQRLINLLQSNGINLMGDLLSMKKENLMKIQNFGTKQLEAILHGLYNYDMVDDQ
jgi:DNA-directed RNA polymerase alpha subunit